MTERPRSLQIYLDTNVFVGFVEGSRTVAAVLRPIFDHPAVPSKTFVTSEITLAEALAPSGQKGRRPLEVRDDLSNLIASNDRVRLEPVTREILLATTDMRLLTRHKLPDAIHCATAFLAGCRFLMSADRDMRRLPPGLPWLDASADGVAALMDALAR